MKVGKNQRTEWDMILGRKGSHSDWLWLGGFSGKLSKGLE